MPTRNSLPDIDIPVIEVYRGDSTSFNSYTFDTDGTPLDLSAWVFTATWRDALRPDAAPVTLAVDVSAAATGKIAVSATDEMTALMEGPGVWDLQGTYNGETLTYVWGRTTWMADVTHG